MTLEIHNPPNRRHPDETGSRSHRSPSAAIPAAGLGVSHEEQGLWVVNNYIGVIIW